MKKFDRTKGIGGSDIAAIVGESPYQSPLDVYMEKRGLVPQKEQSEAMKWGIILEAPIAEEYAQKHNLSPEQIVKPELPLVNPFKEFMFGSPDRIIPIRNMGLEVKAPGLRMANQFGHEGTEEVPPYFLVQCQWYMGLTLYPIWDLAVLLGGQDYREYQVRRDEELIGNLRDLAEKFWVDNVTKGVPPKPDGTQASREALSKLYPQNKGHFIEATPEDIVVMQTLVVARKLVKQGKADKMETENHLKFKIGNADGMNSPMGNITWKRTKGSLKIDYKGIVEKIKEQDPEYWEQSVESWYGIYCGITDGHRRFNVPRSWDKEGE